MRELNHSHPIAKLADEVRFYWAMLHTSIRLEGPWQASLEVRHREAVNEAIEIGRRIAGGQQPINSLADLRQLLMDMIGSILPRLELLVAESSSFSGHEREFARHAIEDVAALQALLVHGVSIQTCSCTTELRARRQLVRRLVGRDAAELVDAPVDLTKLACVEAERRLDECIAVCSTENTGSEPAVAGRRH